MFGKGDPGYKLTAQFVAESALCLLIEKDKLPGGQEYGGVLTTASGMGESLITRLRNSGISFEKIW